MTLLDVGILVSVGLVALVLMMPKVSGNPVWRACITPLASIIGSGFLVLGPILSDVFGIYAIAAMVGLCCAAFGFGAVIRYNIVWAEAAPGADLRIVRLTEDLASVALAGAYFVSVAYYLNLFGAFAVSLTPFDTAFAARAVTSAMFMLILIIGWTRGFAALEQMERFSVTLKLAVVGGLLAGLVWTFGEEFSGGQLLVSPPTVTGWAAVTLCFGLIVTVQGFETSRYLGASYPADIRVRSMRLAQWVSTAIYLVYVSILTMLFDFREEVLTETSIIAIIGLVAVSLPVLLVVAALAAQFSAAIADTAGAGGLLEELSGKAIPERTAYAVLVAVGLGLTWQSDVFAIISYASRAFAAYYALQAVIACVIALRQRRPLRSAFFGAMALLGVAILFLGTSVDV